MLLCEYRLLFPFACTPIPIKHSEGSQYDTPGVGRHIVPWTNLSFLSDKTRPGNYEPDSSRILTVLLEAGVTG